MTDEFQPINVALAPPGVLYPLPPDALAAGGLTEAGLAPGFERHDDWNLQYLGGKTMVELTVVSRYLGGDAAWPEDEVAKIDHAISASMSDAALQTVVAQYFQGQPLTTTILPSAVDTARLPKTVYKDTVERHVKRLYANGALGDADPACAVINLILPRGVVLDSGDRRQSPGTSSKMGLGGFHGSVHEDGTTIYYSVVVYSDGDNGIAAFDEPWKNVSATVYHQLNELRTDADVSDVSETGDMSKLGWYSQRYGEIGDIPFAASGDVFAQVFKEIPLADGSGTVPVQLLWSNADGGPAAATGESIVNDQLDLDSLRRRLKGGNGDSAAWDLSPERTAELVLRAGRRLLEHGDGPALTAALDTAIDLDQMLLTRLEDGSPYTPPLLNDLGVALRARYRSTGDGDDLDRAITACQQCVQALPPDSPGLAAALSNLGVSLSDRYARTGQASDLRAAIDAQRRAVDSLPTGSPEVPGLLGNLGITLGQAFKRSGDPAELEEAIEALEQARVAARDDASELPALLSNLGAALQERYAQSGNPADLDHSVELQEQALELSPSESPDTSSLLTNLGIALGARHAQSGNRKDLDRAVALQEQAITRTPVDSPTRPRLLNNLALGLSKRMSTDRVGDLLRARDLLTEACERVPTPDSPDLAVFTTNLAHVQTQLGVALYRDGQLESAEQAFEHAIGTAPASLDGHIALAAFLKAHGEYARARDQLDRAVGLFEAKGSSNAITPDSALYLGHLMHAFAGDEEKAERIYLAGLSRFPEDGALLAGLISVYMARFHERFSASADPTQPEQSSGRFYWKARSLATRWLREQADATADETMETKLRRGEMLLMLQDYARAQACFEEVLEAAPDSAAAAADAGFLHLALGKWKRAASYLDQACRLDPDDPLYRTSFARAAGKTGSYTHAEAEYMRVLAQAANYTDANIGLGELYLDIAEAGDKRRYHDAVWYLAQALEVEPRAASRPLRPRERAAVLYSRGYAEVKLYEESPLRTRDTQLLRRAMEDFRAATEFDREHRMARSAAERLEQELRQSRVEHRLQGIGSVVAAVQALCIFILAQLAFFAKAPDVRLPVGYYALLSFGSLIFLVAAVSLPELLKLRVGAIELEKTATPLPTTSVTVELVRFDLSPAYSSGAATPSPLALSVTSPMPPTASRTS